MQKAQQILYAEKNPMEDSRMEKGEGDYSFLWESEQMEEEFHGWEERNWIWFWAISNANSCQGGENDNE